MLRWFGIACIFAALLALSVPAATAQEFTFKDGAITFDKQGFKAEFDKMQRDLAAKAKTKSGERALRRQTYCIDCGGSPQDRLVCRAVVGGRVGQALCLLGGAVNCPSPGVRVGGVTEGPC